MGPIEREMIPVLQELKHSFGAIEIKAEFEAEGTSPEELMRLKDVCSCAGLPIIVKIGGAEAITDMRLAMAVGVRGLIAPMVETPFAVGKFLKAIDSVVPEDERAELEFAVNIETISAYEKLPEIFALPGIQRLGSVTVGRVDLVGSLGLERDAIDSPRIDTLVSDIFARAGQAGFRRALGGGISESSLPFIQKLVDAGSLDKFETRKVVFAGPSVAYGPPALTKAVEFELLWLKNKQRYHSARSREDGARIAMLERRLNAMQDNRNLRVAI